MLDALLTRRSIRFGFEPRSVSRAHLEAIVACGLAAPSSKNAQPWRFHVVDDAELLGQLAHLVASARGIDDYVPHDPRTGAPFARYQSTVQESADVLGAAPATIWVENLGAFSRGRQTLLDVPREALAGALEGYGFELMGIGAAVENMWIAATALGLAAAFMGDVVIAEAEIRDVLGLQADLCGVLVVGYSQARPRPPMDAPAFAGSARVVWHRGRAT